MDSGEGVYDAGDLKEGDRYQLKPMRRTLEYTIILSTSTHDDEMVDTHSRNQVIEIEY